MYHRAIRRGNHAELMERVYQKHGHELANHTEPLLAAKERFILDQQAHADALRKELQQLSADMERLDCDIASVIRDLRSSGKEPIDFGDLRRTSPISPIWGLDRGMPLDRHYIHQFLERNRDDIRGRVLEVKDAGYTRLFGSAVIASDVLDIDPDNDQATVVADLSGTTGLPADTYDCFILTQTLGVIFDVGQAVAEAVRLLKPGGVLL